jgi:hypothetical protein
MAQGVAHSLRTAASVLMAGGILLLVLVAGGCGNSAHRVASAPRQAPSMTRTVTKSAHHEGSREKTPTPTLRAGAPASFAALQRQLSDQARISVAVQPLGAGRMSVLGGDPEMLGMSTTKILVLAALLRDRGGVARLTEPQHMLAQAAVTESDNQAILALFSALEADQGGLNGASDYASALLRNAGDPSTTVATAPPPPAYVTTFGQTLWSPTAEVRFFRFVALGCLLPPPDTRYILGLVSQIEPSERWGLGSAGFGTVSFKGGWGPLTNGQYGVRQSGIIGQGDRAVVVAITADPARGFGAGTAVLTDVGRWLRAEVRLTPRPPQSCAAARRS